MELQSSAFGKLYLPVVFQHVSAHHIMIRGGDWEINGEGENLKMNAAVRLA